MADEINPTTGEIRAWAYSGAEEPVQDWDIIAFDLDDLTLLLQLVGDVDCPARHYLLGVLYCLVGHSDRDDPRVRAAVAAAEVAENPWLSTWARRVGDVRAHPDSFTRRDWCGWDGLSTRPVD